MDHQGASTCTWIIFIFGMHSINIRRDSAGVLLYLHGNANTLAVTTMPSSTDTLVQRRNPPICCLLHDQEGRALVNLEESNIG